MSFLNPQAFYGLLLIPVIVILHMIRRQRKHETVSSLFLWRVVLRKNPSTFKRRVRENINLFLQIAAVLCAFTALADPALSLPGRGNRQPQIIILDRSASMNVMEPGGRRIELARREALRLARHNRAGETALILAGGTPEIAVPFTTDVRGLAAGINGAEPEMVPGDIPAALATAFSLSAGGIAPAIVLVSDGAFDLPEHAGMDKRYFRFIQVGSEKGNAGITAFTARQSPVNPGTVQLFLSVINTDPEPWERTLTISGDGREIVNLPMRLDGEEERGTTISIPAGYAEISCSFPGDDPFPEDDTAWIAARNREPSRVLLVSEGSYHLETLLSVFPAFDLTVSPEFRPGEASWDLVIFDSPPPQGLPPGNYIFLGYLPPDLPILADSMVDYPAVDSWVAEHPFLRSVNPRSFAVYRCAGTAALGRAVPVIGAEVPLLYAYEDERYRGAVFTFPLGYSNLPVQPAFPILMGNIAEWLIPGSTGEPYQSGTAGVRITLAERRGAGVRAGAATGAGTAIVTAPGNEPVSVSAGNGVISFLPARPGIYSVDQGGTRELYAVNIGSAEESDISPRFRPGVGGASGDAAEGSGYAVGAGDTAGTASGRREIWKLFAALLLCAAALDILFDRKKRGLPLLKPRYVPVLLGAAVLSLLAAFVNPAIKGSRDSLSLLFLVDASGSVPAMEREKAVRWAEEAAGPLREGDTAGLVLFGSTPLVAAAPETGRSRFAVRSFPEGGTTDMETAVIQGLSLAPPGSDTRLILLSDGNENRGSLLTLLRGLGSAAPPVSVVPLNEERGLNEVTARSMTAPSTVSPGEPFTITLEIESLRPSNGSAVFYLDGEYIGEDAFTLRAGRTLLSYTASLDEPGFHGYEVYVEGEEDGTAENNVFRRGVIVEGDPRVLYVHAEGESSPDLVSALRAQGFSFTAVTPDAFPETLLELLSYKAVILDDIPAYDLSIEKMDLLRRAVSAGTGLLVLGGDSSYGAGGYYRTPLERAMPVDMDISSSTDLPSLVLLMIIDKSGSMGDSTGDGRRKIELAKQAVLSAAEVLNPTHTVGILAFDVGYVWAVPMIPASDTSLISGGLFPIEPAGGTALYPALEEGFRVLSQTPGAVKHILILSDGLTEQGDFEELCGRIREAGVTISTVAVGSDADRSVMEQIALWGRGRNYFTDDIRNVPAIFASESLKVSRRLKVEETFIPRPSVPHEILGGIDPSGIPPLHGFMLSYAKPGAQVLLTGVEDNPLLAVTQYGLGRSAAFTSSLSSAWSSDWRRWDRFGQIFAQTMRWLSRGSADPRMKWTISRSGGKGTLTVDMSDPETGFLNGLDLEARIVSPDGREASVPLEQEEPGRYAGAFTLSAPGIYLVPIAAAGGAGGESQGGETGPAPESAPEKSVLGTAVLSVSYPEEFLEVSPDLEFLREAADITGGRVFNVDTPPAPEFYQPVKGGERNRFPLWPILLLLGFILYFVEVFFRFYSPARIRNGAAFVFSRIFPRKGKKESLTYSQLRGIIEKERFEREEKKTDLSYWFGTDKSQEDSLRLYIAKLRNKGKGSAG